MEIPKEEAMHIVNEEHDYVVSIPEITPTGSQVTIQLSERLGAHILHAQSPDLSELYFEVAAYPSFMTHHQLAEGEREFLSVHSSDGELSPVHVKEIEGYKGTTYDFRGTLQERWKERRFLINDGPCRTYRIVYDPTSLLNEQVLRSLQVGEHHDA
jgi:hypothetical protein